MRRRENIQLTTFSDFMHALRYHIRVDMKYESHKMSSLNFYEKQKRHRKRFYDLVIIIIFKYLF